MYKQAACDISHHTLYELSIILSIDLSVSAHVRTDALVIKQTLDTADCADSDILIPQFPLSKAHYVLLCDRSDDALDFFRTHSTTGCDYLTSDIFCHCGGTVKGKQDRCFELGFGSFDFGFSDIV